MQNEIKKCIYQYAKEVGCFGDKKLWCKLKEAQVIAPIKKEGDLFIRHDWICNSCEDRKENNG